MQKTTKTKLQERQNTPLVLPSSTESFNVMRNNIIGNVNSPEDASKLGFHSRSGYNNQKVGRISLKHNVFVLGIDGKPLTPTTNAKARKLLEGKQARPIWNKFNQFGIQMLVETGRETPKTALGVDFGTKFEGYSVVVGKENNLSVMWKLPHKKTLVKKLEERRILRRARRQRNCRRREARFDNKERKGFIAPSQMMMVNSRLKCMNEFFKCYPIDAVAIEDVCFNHRDKKWGKNFSTIEVGKNYIYNWIKQKANLQMFTGYNTADCRERYNYKKSLNKSAEVFNTHCSDALAIATNIYVQKNIKQGKFIVVDDTYHCIKRRLHDTQFAKGGVRDKYSEGNYKGIRKGTICNLGHICGGIKDKIIRTYDWDNKRLTKNYNKIDWLSHNFKTKQEVNVNSSHD